MKEISLYIHIPFCQKKCNYCNFYSIPYKPDIASDYLASLIKELDQYKDENYKLSSVYFGGGTPSLLSFIQLFPLISMIAHTFDIDEKAEVTLEANPSTINSEKVKGWKTLGINRISIGAQSFHESELNLLGRLHSVQEIDRAAELVAGHCTENYSLDLMYGISGQTHKSWEESIYKAIGLHPKHISSYCLSLEKNTPLYNIKDRLTFPNEDTQRDMYYSMISLLEDHNFPQYEISNFAHAGFESQHNISYWMGREYIGVGAAAHSFCDMTRRENIADVQRYIQSMRNDQSVVQSKKEISNREYISDLIFLGLRLRSGISLTSIKNQFGFDIVNEYKDTIEKFSKLGYLTIENENLKLSCQALFVSDEILSEFV